MAMHVDEAGADGQPAHVQPFGSLSLAQIADGDDPIADHGDVGGESWATGPVDHRSTGQNEGVHRRASFRSMVGAPRAWRQCSPRRNGR